MPTYYRSDQQAIHVSIDGITIDNIVWDSFEGGDITAETVTYPPGGMGNKIDLGGIPSRSDITTAREWSDTLISVSKQLQNGVGAARATITKTTLGANKSVVPGSTETYTGTLKGVTVPPYQAGTAEDAKLSLVFAADVAVS